MSSQMSLLGHVSSECGRLTLREGDLKGLTKPQPQGLVHSSCQRFPGKPRENLSSYPPPRPVRGTLGRKKTGPKWQKDGRQQARNGKKMAAEVEK